MSDGRKCIGFQRIGGGDWYLFDDGTRDSCGDGDRVIQQIETIRLSRRARHYMEASSYRWAALLDRVARRVRRIFGGRPKHNGPASIKRGPLA
jgi:hypothetical protein